MNVDQDTIVAISTPPGRGGIGIVRLSGPEARVVAEPLLRLRHALTHARVRFAAILDLETGDVLDEAVVTFFASPSSYTSDDVVEIACHGSLVLLQYVLRSCIARGARLAEPGEFTQRAFLSGRLDLTQAEAVHDLIASSTLHQARIAAAQLGGSLARVVAPLKQMLVEFIATLEAGVDFAEDDIDLLPQSEVVQRIAAIDAPLTALAGTFAYGRILRDGFSLAIVGRPNVGKSSLFNRLLERDRAFVTAVPGTTRDPIAERLALAGIPVELIDTAGLREAPSGAEGEAEGLGILRSRTLMAESDVVLLVLDRSAHAAGEPLDGEDAATLAGLRDRAPIVVLNKSDLLPAEWADRPERDRNLLGAYAPDSPAIHVSALTGDGIERLKQAILDRLTAPAADSALVTNLRQYTALTEALASLAKASHAAARALPHEMLLLDLYGCLQSLDSLTGATSSSDILALIFSTFCIGK